MQQDYVVPPLSSGRVAGRLAGKVAFVTGTAGGQGRAVALLFARAGARVFGADLPASAARNAETAALADADNLAFAPASVDVSDEVATKAWIEAGVAEAGRIDILYNNAGFAHFAPIEMMTQTQWSETLKYELDVIFNPTRFAWPHMVEQKSGVIINVASGAGSLGTPLFPAAAHSAGKGGVLGLTRHLAVEGAPANIRVNAISPGSIWSPATSALTDDMPYKRVFIHASALARVGEPEDVAFAALFLASDEAAWITGIDLPVDGGYSCKGGVRE